MDIQTLNKIKKYLPNFSIVFGNNQLTVEFDEDILKTVQALGCTFTTSEIYCIEFQDNEGVFNSYIVDINGAKYELFLFGEFRKENYSLLDMVRDTLASLVGDKPEYAPHVNIADVNYKKEIDGYFGRVAEYNLYDKQFPACKILINKNVNITPKYKNYKSSKRMSKFSENEKPLFIVQFNHDVNVYTNVFTYHKHVLSQNFGIHMNSDDLYNNFSIYAYDSYFGQGLCILERQTIKDSFLDLYDPFDVLQILLYSIQTENQQISLEIYEEIDLANLPLEL